MRFLRRLRLAAQPPDPAPLSRVRMKPVRTTPTKEMKLPASADGQDLVLVSRPKHSSIDETQVAERLSLAPGERIKLFERNYANVRELALSAAQSRGELA